MNETTLPTDWKPLREAAEAMEPLRDPPRRPHPPRLARLLGAVACGEGGADGGATAPRWARYVATDGSAYWILEGAGFAWHKFDDPVLAKIVDPTAALRAALLAVEPA